MNVIITKPWLTRRNYGGITFKKSMSFNWSANCFKLLIQTPFDSVCGESILRRWDICFRISFKSDIRIKLWTVRLSWIKSHNFHREKKERRFERRLNRIQNISDDGNLFPNFSMFLSSSTILDRLFWPTSSGHRIGSCSTSFAWFLFLLVQTMHVFLSLFSLVSCI